MEYVKITYPARRLVYIDDEESGHTNEVLRVEAGTHRFELGKLANYRPATRTVTVEHTKVLEPLEIRFFRKGEA